MHNIIILICATHAKNDHVNFLVNQKYFNMKIKIEHFFVIS